MTDLDKAREWAKANIDGGYFYHGDRALDAAEIIQSLPDQWVDVEKVREIIEEMKSLPDTTRVSSEIAIATEAWKRRLEALLTPKLPTLADMTPEERAACKWMQCMIGDDTDDYCLLITVDTPCSRVVFQNGNSTIWNNDLITPLPDLPKLEWPGEIPRKPYLFGGTSSESDLPDMSVSERMERTGNSIKPEDVPPNEPWLIEANGQKAIGTRYKGDAVLPWFVAALDGSFADDYHDSVVTLIHKLVPETHTLPEGMRLADHKEYGRVVVSQRADKDGDYRVFFSDDDGIKDEPGAHIRHVHKSVLTFLDGEA